MNTLATRFLERNSPDDSQARLKQHFDLVLGAIAEGILGVDLDGTITFANSAARRLLQWDDDALIGRQAHGTMRRAGAGAPADNSPDRPIDATFRDGNVRQVKGDFFLRKDGTEFPVDYSVTPIEYERGGITGALVVFRDVTEERKLEAQFLRAQRIESIGALTGGIAHDLNNILGPILMAVDLFKMRLHDPGDLDLLGTVESSARRGAEIVRQVLSFARGFEGQRVIIRPVHLLREMEKIAAETFPKSIVVSTSEDDSVGTLVGDPTLLHQVLLNLCVNARDAMPEGGRLRLSASHEAIDEQFAAMHPHAKPGSYIVIEVADSGMGMRPEVAGKIFDPFFTTKEIGKETGIGLSAVLAIVKSHGGFVIVESTPDCGTAFRVYLPPDAEGPEITDAGPGDLPRGSGELILLIDDEAAVRSITGRTLEAFGYRVATACDGAEGVAIYAQRCNKIAAVVTDMMMPVMDGATTIRVLTRINPAVKIVAASGLAARGIEAEIAVQGVRHFIRKPYTAEALLKMLRDLLRRGA